MLPDRAKLQYVLFDWDGTLADNAEVVHSSVKQVLAEYGLPDWEVMKSRRDPKLSLWDTLPICLVIMLFRLMNAICKSTNSSLPVC